MDGVAGVKFLRNVHVVQMNVPPIAHYPFARRHVEVAGDLATFTVVGENRAGRQSCFASNRITMCM